MNIEIDDFGRPFLDEETAQGQAFFKLLRAAKEPDDWEGPLGAAAEIALRLNNSSSLLSVIFRNEILYARSLGDLAAEIGYTEEDVRRGFGLER